MENNEIIVASNRAERSAPESEISTETTPKSDWNLDQLAEYVKQGFQTSGRAEQEAKALYDRLSFTAKTSIIAYFRAGSALAIAQEKLKQNGEWCRWLEQHNLNRKSVLTAITIFREGKSEEEVAKYSLAEAKRKWSYDKPKTKLPKLGPKPRPVDPYPGVQSDPAPAAAGDWPDVSTMLDEVTHHLKDMLLAPAAAAEDWQILRPQLDDLAMTIEEMRRRISPVVPPFRMTNTRPSVTI